jgi:hypothetical protein
MHAVAGQLMESVKPIAGLQTVRLKASYKYGAVCD